MLLCGHVIRLLDTDITPTKVKRHICVCPADRLFLRLNTTPLWKPHLRVAFAANSAFLDHDSYVELRQVYRPSRADLDQAMARPDNPLGRISGKLAMEIMLTARGAEMLSEDMQDIIWERFTEAFMPGRG
jgi:hypothetical protein